MKVNQRQNMQRLKNAFCSMLEKNGFAAHTNNFATKKIDYRQKHATKVKDTKLNG